MTTDARPTNVVGLRSCSEIPEGEGFVASALDKVARLQLVQHAPTATQTAHSNASNIFFASTAGKLNVLQSYALLSQPHNQSTTTSLWRTTLLGPEHLEFTPTRTYIAHTSKPKHKLRILYKVLTKIMHIALCLLNIRANINLIRSEMIPQEWTHRKKWKNLPSLLTNTRQPQWSDSLICFHLCLGDLQTRLWLCVAPQLDVSMLLGTSFIDLFIQKNVSLERNIVPSHSHPVPILAYQRPSPTAETILLSPAPSKTATHHVNQNECTKAPVKVARRIVDPPNTAAQVLVITPASKLLLIESHLQYLCGQEQSLRAL